MSADDACLPVNESLKRPVIGAREDFDKDIVEELLRHDRAFIHEAKAPSQWTGRKEPEASASSVDRDSARSNEERRRRVVPDQHIRKCACAVPLHHNAPCVAEDSSSAIRSLVLDSND